MAESLYVMTPTEIAWGYVLGDAGELPPPSDPTIGARTALEQLVRVALQRPPCGVAFSGGRDSSLVLAVATHVARRDGLAEPVPITRVFPGVTEAAEHEWQQAVVRHLGLTEWQRLEIHDELDVIGPFAQQHLVAHGVVWPPAIAGDAPLVAAVPGGSVVDGEGGDEVLGIEAHRIAPVHRLVRRPRPLRWRRVRRALGAVAPAPIRRRYATRRWQDETLAWLRPAARDEFRRALIAEDVATPLTFAASVRRVPQHRAQVLASANRRVLAAPADVAVTSPLLDPEFVHAVAREGRALGRGDRTAVLTALASDLLPPHVLGRTGKATFNTCYVAGHARAFAAGWDGTGLDDDVVDPDELRRTWLDAQPHALTQGLLQAAWLATVERHPMVTGMSRVDVVDPDAR